MYLSPIALIIFELLIFFAYPVIVFPIVYLKRIRVRDVSKNTTSIVRLYHNIYRFNANYSSGTNYCIHFGVPCLLKYYISIMLNHLYKKDLENYSQRKLSGFLTVIISLIIFFNGYPAFPISQ